MDENTTPTLLMGVSPNQGYAPDQVSTKMTLKDLRAAIDEAIEDFGEDARIVTIDGGNRYGAKFGSIDTWNTFSEADPE